MYRVVDLMWQVLDARTVVFWPVLARPGRQRNTRACFEHPSSAATYGMRLEARYRRFVGAPIAKKSEVAGAHLCEFCLREFTCWMNVGVVTECKYCIR